MVKNMDEYSSSEEDLDVVLKCVAEDTDDSSKSSTAASDTGTGDSTSEDEERRVIAKSENFVEKVIPRFDDKQFRAHFRLSRFTFQYILAEVQHAEIMPSYKAGRENVTAEKAILMTVWYLANLETYRQISDRFNVCQSTALMSIRNVVKYLVSVKSRYIKWPSDHQATEISENFENRQGIRGIVGAIDGTHISIRKPHEDQNAYCNRKGYHSILLQGICDHKKRFINIYCGEAGSLHDARVLRLSSIYRRAMSENGLLGERFLLGDSAYPNLSWLVPPFKDNGHLTRQQKLFNVRHSSTRVVIENSYGLLKGRFRRLKHFENLNVYFIVEAVVASCVLHNICILMNDPEDDIEFHNNEGIEPIEDPEGYLEAEANQIDRRQLILNEMFNVF